MKHACISNNTVVKIVDVVTSEHYEELTKNFVTVISIEDLLIEPQIGWVLNSTNVLVPGPEQQISLDELIKSKIRSFQKMAPELLVEMYTQNTLMGITTAQSDAMFEQFQDVLIRIREGAWPTAVYKLSQKQPSGFVTQEMIDSWKNLLIQKMQ
jgi:hypothetical protein